MADSLGFIIESESVRSRFSRCLSLIEIDSHWNCFVLAAVGSVVLPMTDPDNGCDDG